MTEPSTTEPSGNNPAHEAVEHLQAAAVEVIKATRAFLDLAEQLVEDPGPVADLIAGFAAKGRRAAQGASDSPGEEGPKVQRIRVS